MIKGLFLCVAVVVLALVWQFMPPNHFRGQFPTAQDMANAGGNLTGINFIVTGSNTGIGLETVRVLALQGATVIMGCRNTAKAEAARQKVLATMPGGMSLDAVAERVIVEQLDLSSLGNVQAFAERFVKRGTPLHGMVLNAGLNAPEPGKTKDGLELVNGVNWVAHFYLCQLLHPVLESSATAARPSRVVHVASQAHTFVGIPGMGPMDANGWLDDWQFEEREYNWLSSYSQSKFMQVSGSLEMNKRWGPSVISHSLHPGNIKTDMYEANQGWLSFITFAVWPFNSWVRTVEEGASAQVRAAVHPDYSVGGAYIQNDERFDKPAISSSQTHDPAISAKVWALSEKAVKDAGFVY